MSSVGSKAFSPVISDIQGNIKVGCRCKPSLIKLLIYLARKFVTGSWQTPYSQKHWSSW
jgi:hypothetical protein